MTIVWNGALASIFLGERFTAWDGLVTLTIITGAIIAVVFGAVGASLQPTYDIVSVVEQLSRLSVLIATVLVSAMWITSFFAVRWIASYGAARTRLQIRIECYLRIFLAGLLTGVNGMFAAAVVKSITGAVDGNEVRAWQFWCFVVGLVPGVLLQLGYLNSALAQLDSLEVVPPFQVNVIFVGLVWGMVFTGDASGASVEAIALFTTGCAISCAGVLLLAFKRSSVRRLDAWLIKHGCGRFLAIPPPPDAAALDAAAAALDKDGSGGDAFAPFLGSSTELRERSEERTSLLATPSASASSALPYDSEKAEPLLR